MKKDQVKIRRIALDSNQTPFWGWKRNEEMCSLRSSDDEIECGTFHIPLNEILDATMHRAEELCPFSRMAQVLRIRTHNYIFDISGQPHILKEVKVPIEVQNQQTRVTPPHIKKIVFVVIFTIVILTALMKIVFEK